MSAAKSRPATAAAPNSAAAKRAAKRRAAAREEAALRREFEALLEKINRGLDELHAKADRMLARYE